MNSTCGSSTMAINSVTMHTNTNCVATTTLFPIANTGISARDYDRLMSRGEKTLPQHAKPLGPQATNVRTRST